MVAMAHGIDWTQILLYGVPAYIAAIGGAVAAVIAASNGRALKSSNGATIAENVEKTHAAVVETADKVNTMAEEQATP